MNRFAIEHLPRTAARYQVTPVDYEEACTWLNGGEVMSLVRTTEMAGAIASGMGVTLQQSDSSMTLQAGDEALLICLSFSMLLAWAEGNIVPLHEDWRCLLLRVDAAPVTTPRLAAATSHDLASESKN